MGFSGNYNFELILGDALAPLPMRWKFATVEVRFPQDVQVQVQEDPFAKKPEIQHTYRTADKRPPVIISMVFTGVVLSPALILLIGVSQMRLHR